MAEQRAVGDLEIGLAGTSAPIVFVVTSIFWREAWKYGDRAYRYCLLDVGHAWQALSLAARAVGCDSFATAHFSDGEIAKLCGFADDEWPMLIVELRGASIPVREPASRETVWYGGRANRLSEEITVYPAIDEIHNATKLSDHACPGISAFTPATDGSGEIMLPAARHLIVVALSDCDVRVGTESLTLRARDAILIENSTGQMSVGVSALMIALN